MDAFHHYASLRPRDAPTTTCILQKNCRHDLDLGLVGLESAHDRSHLVIAIYPESLVLGDAGQLHVLGVQLLLHNLLQCLQDQNLGLCQRQGLVELVLKLGLCTFGT